MIEIDLNQQGGGQGKGSFLSHSILGHLNIKAVTLALLLSFFGKSSIVSYWEGLREEQQASIDVLKSELDSMQENGQQFEDTEGELANYRKRIKELESSSASVSQVLSTSSNPLKLLERVAKGTPEDLWLTKLEIHPEGRIDFEGMSVSYKSIGNFMATLNQTPYFSNSLNLEESNTLEGRGRGQSTRVEKFSITGQVKDFAPFKN